MADKLKLLARCAPTPPPGGGSTTSRGTGRLPEELLSEQVERLAIFAAVIGALWTYGIIADLVIIPLFMPAFAAQEIHGAAVPIEVAGILLSILMVLYFRRARLSAETKITTGFGYMIANAIGIALLNNWIVARMASPAPGIHLSWITNLILVFSMIAPADSRRMLIASLIAASMDPLAAWLAHPRDVPTPPVMNIVLQYLPNYTAALVATVPGKIMHRLGRRLREAQEMGSYQLIELLGQGGMGEVWRARHRLLARNAAIKIVRPEFLGANAGDTKLMLRRFEREAQATAALSSPHTIRVFDYGMTDEGTFYYVMELLSGRNLESLVKEFGPVPASRAMFLLRQVCHSLADAHARGMVHRDIKPANIFTCRMGLEYDFVKVLDFGLVKYNYNGRAAGQTLMTLEQTTTGTPAYMAPEVILGEVNVDRRADVYAVGCVAYYLLTGQLVFEADTPMKMMLQHVQAEPIPPSQRTELPISPELDAIVMACLQKDPSRRPQDAEELFHLTADCKTCEGWTHDIARTWWEHHLPEMTGPLILGEPEPDAAILAGAAR
jgi:serine/threonine-protein kinase